MSNYNYPFQDAFRSGNPNIAAGGYAPSIHESLAQANKDTGMQRAIQLLIANSETTNRLLESRINSGATMQEASAQIYGTTAGTVEQLGAYAVSSALGGPDMIAAANNFHAAMAGGVNPAHQVGAGSFFSGVGNAHQLSADILGKHVQSNIRSGNLGDLNVEEASELLALHGAVNGGMGGMMSYNPNASLMERYNSAMTTMNPLDAASLRGAVADHGGGLGDALSALSGDADNPLAKTAARVLNSNSTMGLKKEDGAKIIQKIKELDETLTTLGDIQGGLSKSQLLSNTKALTGVYINDESLSAQETMAARNTLHSAVGFAKTTADADVTIQGIIAGAENTKGVVQGSLGKGRYAGDVIDKHLGDFVTGMGINTGVRSQIMDAAGIDMDEEAANLKNQDSIRAVVKDDYAVLGFLGLQDSLPGVSEKKEEVRRLIAAGRTREARTVANQAYKEATGHSVEAAKNTDYFGKSMARGMGTDGETLVNNAKKSFSGAAMQEGIFRNALGADGALIADAMVNDLGAVHTKKLLDAESPADVDKMLTDWVRSGAISPEKADAIKGSLSDRPEVTRGLLEGGIDAIKDADTAALTIADTQRVVQQNALDSRGQEGSRVKANTQDIVKSMLGALWNGDKAASEMDVLRNLQAAKSIKPGEPGYDKAQELIASMGAGDLTIADMDFSDGVGEAELQSLADAKGMSLDAVKKMYGDGSDVGKFKEAMLGDSDINFHGKGDHFSIVKKGAVRDLMGESNLIAHEATLNKFRGKEGLKEYANLRRRIGKEGYEKGRLDTSELSYDHDDRGDVWSNRKFDNVMSMYAEDQEALRNFDKNSENSVTGALGTLYKNLDSNKGIGTVRVGGEDMSKEDAMTMIEDAMVKLNGGESTADRVVYENAEFRNTTIVTNQIVEGAME